jgi:hypothetical protein
MQLQRRADACNSNTPIHELRYGSGAPVACVVPDQTYRGMWRVISAGGLSDMVNLARARDGAMAICEGGPPPRNRARLHWLLKRSESPTEGRTARQREAG